VKEQS